jgi:hypothetical protein
MSLSIDTMNAADTHDHRGVAPASPHSNVRLQTTYRVLLTTSDLRLIQACSTWIRTFQPSPDIRTRFAHLDEQLARARPVAPGLAVVNRHPRDSLAR